MTSRSPLRERRGKVFAVHATELPPGYVGSPDPEPLVSERKDQCPDAVGRDTANRQ